MDGDVCVSEVIRMVRAFDEVFDDLNPNGPEREASAAYDELDAALGFTKKPGEENPTLAKFIGNNRVLLGIYSFVTYWYKLPLSGYVKMVVSKHMKYENLQKRKPSTPPMEEKPETFPEVMLLGLMRTSRMNLWGIQSSYLEPSETRLCLV